MSRTKQPTTIQKTGKADTAAKAPPAPIPAASTPTQPALPPAPEGFINVFVDGTLLHVKKGSTVMQACTQAEKEIPHFCYHERLSIAGNCRMCLVEIEGMPKPVASCHWPAAEGMKVKTDSKITTDARKGTMELLLINHPLDCPICDQGGECALQDQSVAYGGDRSHYHEFKRAVDDKNIGAKIKTVMTRCIHCTRCIRFATEVAGVEEFGATGRGENMQVGTYVEQAIQSELSGNMIDLCPVGALTNKPYAFTARPWELVRTHSVDILDAIGTPITVDNRHGQVMRTLPVENDAINEEWMTDAARFSYDALNTNRLTAPLIRRGKKLETASWAEAFSIIRHKLSQAKSTAGIMGAMQSAQDAFAFKSFLTHTLKTGHIDSRPAGSTLTAANAHLGITLKEFDTATSVLLIGCNPRWEAPLLNVRLRRAALKRRVPIASIGQELNLTYPHQHLGTSPDVLAELLKKHAFTETMKATPGAAIILSASVLNRADGEAILATAHKLAAKTGASVSVLADTCGRLTALNVGVLPQGEGKDTSAILKSWHKGQIDVLFVYGSDTISAEDVKGGKGTLVYIGTHRSELPEIADICLPAAAWSEKNGWYVNAERRLLPAFAAVPPPLNAKEDWKIFRALSEEVNKSSPLPFNNLSQLNTALTKAFPHMAATQFNRILPKPEQKSKSATGDTMSKSFVAAISAYYLRSEYLRQSPTMQACQAETGTAQLGKVVAMPKKPSKSA